MLSNLDIVKLAEQLETPIVGVFSKNELPEYHQVGSYYINLQNSDDGDGTHWTYFRIFDDGSSVYFDSFGIGQPKEVASFLKDFRPVFCNNRQIQDINTTSCGYYCLFCDYYLTHCRRFEDPREDFNNFLDLWSDNPRDNLTLLKAFLKPL